MDVLCQSGVTAHVSRSAAPQAQRRANGAVPTTAAVIGRRNATLPVRCSPVRSSTRINTSSC